MRPTARLAGRFLTSVSLFALLLTPGSGAASAQARSHAVRTGGRLARLCRLMADR